MVNVSVAAIGSLLRILVLEMYVCHSILTRHENLQVRSHHLSSSSQYLGITNKPRPRRGKGGSVLPGPTNGQQKVSISILSK